MSSGIPDESDTVTNLDRHRKRIHHYHTPGDCHELTFSCYRRQQLLVDNVWRAWLAKAVDRAMAACSMRLAAFVFMPEHVHMLVCSFEYEVSVPRLLKAIKQPFSSQVKRALQRANDDLLDQLTLRERSGKREFRFWQQGPGYDRNLTSPKALLASIDYIHSNPVKRGLCFKATDWKWSSARYYADPVAAIDPDLPMMHGLDSSHLI